MCNASASPKEPPEISKTKAWFKLRLHVAPGGMLLLMKTVHNGEMKINSRCRVSVVTGPTFLFLPVKFEI